MRICRVLFSAALAFSFLGVCSSNAEHALGQSNPSGEATESEVVAHFKAGQEATRAGQAERAIQEYREVLRLRPNVTEARVNLGLDYFMSGQYQQASIELEKARQEKPHLVAANLFLGMTYVKLGFPAKAVPPLEEVLRQDSANQEALRALAASYLDRANYLDATNVYLKLFASNADPIEGWYVLGQNYMGMARQLGDENSKKFFGTPWSARLDGDVLAEDQKWVDAAAHYRRALLLNDKIRGLHAALGDMLLRNGKLEDAEAEYRAELHSDAKSEEALLGLAATDLGHNEAALALERVTKIWEVAPPFLESHANFPSIRIETPKLTALAQDLASAADSPPKEFLLACIYRAAGQNELAAKQWSLFLSSLQAWGVSQKNNVGIPGEQAGVACAAHRYAECAQRLLAQELRSPEQDNLLGRAEWALGNKQAAAAAFAEGLNRDRANAQSSYWLIRSYQRLALTCLNHLVELAPDSWRVHQIQGEYYQSRFDYKKAIKEFQTAVRMHPGSAELHEQLGNAYLLDKNAAEGKAEIEKALQIDPTRSLSLYLLGRVYFRNRDIPKSIEYLQAALRFDPRFLPARADLGRAYTRASKPASAVPELEKAASTDYDGDLHYLLSVAYRQLGKTGLAEQALAVSQELRKKSGAHHEAGVAAAEEELADQ
jgi:tetratricopeptide (TPR) repeat protein